MWRDIVDGGGIYVSPNAGPSNFAGKECHKNYYVVSWQNDTLQFMIAFIGVIAVFSATAIGVRLAAATTGSSMSAGRSRARRWSCPVRPEGSARSRDR